MKQTDFRIGNFILFECKVQKVNDFSFQSILKLKDKTAMPSEPN